MPQGFLPERQRLVDLPFFPYRGGKARLRRYIVRWCQTSGTTYCEPFAGRANLFFLMKGFATFQKWHLNDIQTIPFFQAIKQYGGEHLPTLSKEESVILFESGDPLSLLLEPITFWAGGLASKTSATGNRGHDLDEYRRKLLLARDLLVGVDLTCQDAVDVVEEYSPDPQAFLYVDPPYQGASVGIYKEGMVDFPRLFRLLHSAKCRWLFSEYLHSNVIENLAPPLTTIKGVVVNPIPGGIVRDEVEGLWSNYPMKPIVLDFDDSEKPLAESKAVLHRYREFTYEGWKKLVPKRWTEKTIKAQFARLTTWPTNYFDGETLRIIEDM